MKFEIAKGFEDKGINLPKRGTAFSAGYDFEAAEDIVIPSIWKISQRKISPVMESRPVSWDNNGEPIAAENVVAYHEFNNREDLSHEGTLVPTGVKAKMPENMFLALYNRSSNFNKMGLMLGNNAAVIDSDYYGNVKNDGHIMINLVNFGFQDVVIKKGTRLAQGVFQQFFVTEDDAAEGIRESGFGSTGA